LTIYVSPINFISEKSEKSENIFLSKKSIKKILDFQFSEIPEISINFDKFL